MNNEIDDIFNELEYSESSVIQGIQIPESGINLLKSSQKDSEIGRITSLGEIFIEWYLFDPKQAKDIKTFLETEDLADKLTETDFTDIMNGNAYLQETFLLFIMYKLPFSISSNKVSYLNAQVPYTNPNARIINPPYDLWDRIREQKQQNDKIKKEAIAEYRKKYRQNNKEAIAEYQKKYQKNNKEAIAEYQKKYHKKYYQNNKEAIAESHKKYRQNNKEAIAEGHKKYRQNNKEVIAERNKKYYQNNKKAIAESHKKYYQNNKEAIAERNKKYRQNNKEAIAERNKKYRQNNKEAIIERTKKHSKDKKNKQNKFAKKFCAAYILLSALRKSDYLQYVKLFTRKQDPLFQMLKVCSALKNTDINMCPLCNPNCENTLHKCCNQKVLALPNALSKLQIIANNLKQKQ